MTETSAPALCRLEDVPEGGVREVSAVLDGEVSSLVILRQGQRVEAFHNVCPHAGRPLNWAPGRFLVEAGLLICAAHGASFTIPDGRCVGGPCRGSALRGVPVRVVDGELWLDLSTPG